MYRTQYKKCMRRMCILYVQHHVTVSQCREHHIPYLIDVGSAGDLVEAGEKLLESRNAWALPVEEAHGASFRALVLAELACDEAWRASDRQSHQLHTSASGWLALRKQTVNKSFTCGYRPALLRATQQLHPKVPCRVWVSRPTK